MNNNARPRLRWIVLSLVVVALLMVGYAFGAVQPLGTIVNTMLSPLESVFYKATDRLFPLYEPELSTVVNENAQLKLALVSAIDQVTTLEDEKAQFSEYREQLAFAQQNEYTILPAQVVSRIGQGVSTPIVRINRGMQDGLQVGYPVLYGNGYLMGVVYEVSDTTAEVALITSTLIKIQGQVVGADTMGVLSGQFGTSVQMEFILKNQPIAEGDVVVTNGEDRYVPRNLVIGTVQKISDDSSDLFKSATVVPVVQYGTNSIVSVVLPN